MSASRDPAKVGLGSYASGKPGDRRNMPRIVVSFPVDTFEEVRAAAVKDGISFAEKVRELVEWGLEA